MNKMYLIVLITTLSTLTTSQNCPKRKLVICYWASWSVYRPDKGNYQVESINPQYCTHLVYTFAGININGALDSLDYYNDVTKGTYKKFTQLKEQYPCIKILLAIGGWNEGSEKYSFMAATEDRRKFFVDSLMRFVIHFGFDGVDINWSYPAHRNGLPEDKNNYIKLLQLLSQESVQRSRLITAAVSPSIGVIRTAYNTSEMCKYLNFINIMGYDMHLGDRASAHAPLRKERTESVHRETLDAAVQYYINNGCPKDKLILGIPSYGKSVTLKNPYAHNLGAEIIGVGKAGPLTKTAGFLGFNEICANMNATFGWRTYHLSENAVKYAYKDNQWFSYDDPDTVKQKAKYVLQNNLAGIMIWSIDTDDFNGNCYGQRYPLLIAANKGLGNVI